MPNTAIAAQLYTLRDFLKTPEDIASTLHRVAEIGYGAVQLSSVGPIEPAELRAICDREGLTICANHTPWEQLRDDLDAVIAENEVYGCRHTAIPIPPESMRNAEGYAQLAREASVVAQKAKERGLVIGYHNHSFEFEKYDGRTGLEILYSESTADLTAEIDTYWVQHGGGDPAWWLRRVAGRSPLVHLKDLVMRGREQLMAEVGEGNLNWPAILDACKDAGVEWYIIEQDHCQRDPFESLAISLRNLKAMGIA
jgi:sugar phosphate isomerase/epimerase